MVTPLLTASWEISNMSRTIHRVKSPCADLRPESIRLLKALKPFDTTWECPRRGTRTGPCPERRPRNFGLTLEFPTSVTLTNYHHSLRMDVHRLGRSSTVSQPFFHSFFFFSRGQYEGIRCMPERSRSEHHIMLICFQS